MDDQGRYTGSVVGLAVGDALGARLGFEAIPAEWARDVERAPELLSLGERLFSERV